MDIDKIKDIMESYDKIMIIGGINAKHPARGANTYANTAGKKLMSIIN